VKVSGEEVKKNPELTPHYGQLLSYQIGLRGKWAQFKTKSDDGDGDTNQELVWFRNLRDGTLSRMEIPGVRFVGFPTWNAEASVGVLKALTGSLTHSTPEFFLITRTTNTSPDHDSDGLPDDWEAAYFTEGNAIPEADSDGDGTTNHLEFLAGTDPMDPLSVFRIETIDEVNGDTVRLQWPAMQHKVYAVEYRDGITSDSWIKSGKPVQVNDGKAIYRDRVTVDRTFRFYRLTIEEP